MLKFISFFEFEVLSNLKDLFTDRSNRRYATHNKIQVIGSPFHIDSDSYHDGNINDFDCEVKVSCVSNFD